MSNRRERRAGAKKVRKGNHVMFCISAPPLDNIVAIRTDKAVYEAMKWIDPDCLDGKKDMDITLLDKDIIRAIYYPDDVLGLKETPDKFACALAESVKLWSKRLTPEQRLLFDRVGLHHLEIEPMVDEKTGEEGVAWSWEFNRNNNVSIGTETAWLFPLANLEMGSPESHIYAGIGIAHPKVIH